jgi:hypothetical protein
MYYISLLGRIEGERVKHILIKDMERCPYVPKDPEYATWNEKNDKRLAQISAERELLRKDAAYYLSHHDKTVRNMAKFISNFLDE